MVILLFLFAASPTTSPGKDHESRESSVVSSYDWIANTGRLRNTIPPCIPGWLTVRIILVYAMDLL